MAGHAMCIYRFNEGTKVMDIIPGKKARCKSYITPCLKCLSHDVSVYRYGKHNYYVECNVCDDHVRCWDMTVKKAVTSWSELQAWRGLVILDVLNRTEEYRKFMDTEDFK